MLPSIMGSITKYGRQGIEGILIAMKKIDDLYRGMQVLGSLIFKVRRYLK